MAVRICCISFGCVQSASLNDSTFRSSYVILSRHNGTSRYRQYSTICSSVSTLSLLYWQVSSSMISMSCRCDLVWVWPVRARLSVKLVGGGSSSMSSSFGLLFFSSYALKK